MDTSDLLKKVRKIEIKTRGLSNQLFAGEYHSAFKGSGMTFNEVRDYHPGDEIRKIDWNVTARFNSPFVKVFEEEREMTVMLLVDTSASEFFGTRVQLKKELITEICAVLSFSAIQNNDKIGVIFFGNEVEKFIPPKKGKSHILRIIRELISFEPQTQGTNIGEALRYLTNAIKKKSTAFLLSDFLDEKNYENALKVANKKHDLIGLRIYDRLQEDLPNIGLVPFYDAESGSTVLVDTSSKSVRTDYNLNSRIQREGLFDQFKKAGIDYANISTQDNYVRPLMNLFKKRERRR
jgi:uncharacterized protein (DUF58 family)|tara:strand:+ start:2609 stop:3487 length:879 start_codon:yes stop_codon:yes gene_type:complete